MKTLIVNSKFNNKKLSSFVKFEFPNLSQNTLYKALRKKDIRINGSRISEDIVVNEGDKIDIYIIDELLYGEAMQFDIVFEDNNILVLNKPKNIEVTGNNSLTEAVQKKYSNSSILPCHRLDRNTEGLILFAKNSESLEILLSKFKNHEIVKAYKCKVIGILDKKHNVLNAFLFKDNKKAMVYISDKNDFGYRPISTEYTVLEENKEKNYSILEVVLHTGRTHQIRAHLAHIGHPIIRRSVNMESIRLIRNLMKKLKI